MGPGFPPAANFATAARGVDFAACASYKWLMGDFGLGFFYVREDVLARLPHVQYGWRQFEEFEYHMLPGDPPGEAYLGLWPHAGAQVAAPKAPGDAQRRLKGAAMG